MKLAAIFLAAAAAAPGAAWAVYKCPLPGGGTAFQDQPCEGGQRLNVQQGTPSNAAAAESTRRVQSEIAAIEWRSRVRVAIESGQPLVGMTRSELDSAMGPPTRVNADNYGGTLRDQIIYERRDQTWYVYTENGKVSSIQNRPAISVGSAPAGGRCPDAIEIKNMETAAASISLTEGERVQRLRELADARRCR